MQTWLAAAEISGGPVFRLVLKGGRVQPVAMRRKLYVERAGLDLAEFSGHSLRTGFLTSAPEAGASVFKMMEVSRHKSMDTLRGYVRRALGRRSCKPARWLLSPRCLSPVRHRQA